MKSNLGQMWAGMPPPETRARQDLEAKIIKLEHKIAEHEQRITNNMGSLKPGVQYIYEHRDGKVYAREAGASPDTAVVIGGDWKPDSLETKLHKLEQDIVELKQLVQRLVPSVMPVNPTTWRRSCTVCGTTTESAMGYVCSNPSCPVRITSTRVVTQPSVYIDLDREQA